MERDLLELMVAYGFVDPDTIAGASPAAPIRERPAPARTPGLGALRLAVGSAAPRAGRTTLVAGLAAAWARAGRSVLVVDLDPSDELARVLLFGSAITINTGQLLLRAVAEDGIAEPSHTLLPGVDVVANGGIALDPAPLAERLRRRPTALRDALAPWLGRYDRVLVDVPTAPNALWAAARTLTDGGILALPARAVDAGAPARLGRDRKRVGVVLTRLDPAAPPPAEALAALAAEGLVDTAVPELPGLRCAWDVVSGVGGATADAAFAALARDLEGLRPGPRPVKWAEPASGRASRTAAVRS